MKTTTRTNLQDACRHTCPAGRPCVCAARSHSLHICADITCRCHSQNRYDPPGAAVAHQQTIIARRNGRK